MMRISAPPTPLRMISMNLSLRQVLLVALLLCGCGKLPDPKVSSTPKLAAQAESVQPEQDSKFPPLANIGNRQAGEDWPSFLGVRRDSKSLETGFVPAEEPKVLWRKRFGEGYSIGSVARGRYFQFYRERDAMILECLNAETGDSLWKYDYPTDYSDRYQYNGGPRTSPVIDADADLVFAYGPEGMLVALRASSGEQVWKVNTFEKYGVVQNFFGVGSTPLVDGEKLIVIVGGSPREDQDQSDFMALRPNQTAIVAFNKRTGKELYKSGEELASYASPIIGKVGEERLGFAFVRGGLLGFEPENGKTRFHFPWRARILESVNAATPVIDGSRVLISEAYGPGSALLDLASGEPKVVWQDDPRKRDKAMKAHWNTPVLHDGYIYGSSGRHAGDAELRCVDFSTGEVQWSVPELTRSSLLFVDGHFLCQCETGEVIVFKANPKAFEKVCELRLPEPLREPAWSAPILSHGLAYFRDERWTVCVDLIPEKK
jgi:outer membrane protein assembly factor BamB